MGLFMFKLIKVEEFRPLFPRATFRVLHSLCGLKIQNIPARQKAVPDGTASGHPFQDRSFHLILYLTPAPEDTHASISKWPSPLAALRLRICTCAQYFLLHPTASTFQLHGTG